MAIYDALLDDFVLRRRKLNIETLRESADEVFGNRRGLLGLDQFHDFVLAECKGENFDQEICSQGRRDASEETFEFFLRILSGLGRKNEENDILANLSIELNIRHGSICGIHLLLEL